MDYKEEKWDIGCYYGERSVCVNLHYDGKTYHRHDYFSIFPRWLRIGWYVRSIEKESGCFRDSCAFVKENNI